MADGGIQCLYGVCCRDASSSRLLDNGEKLNRLCGKVRLVELAMPVFLDVEHKEN